MEYIVWGREKHEPSWLEIVRLETTNKDEAYKTAGNMAAAGYVTRVQELNMTVKPNFVGAINL